MLIRNLSSGIVVQTKAQSFTGSCLYSDVCHGYDFRGGSFRGYMPLATCLTRWARYPVLGVMAGVTRIALGVIHVVAHLLTALITQNKGHLWHAAKGGCEMIRGVIEAIPLVGRIFSNMYGIRGRSDPLTFMISPSNDSYCFWMIKIYNPEAPDDLDEELRLCEPGLKRAREEANKDNLMRTWVIRAKVMESHQE